MDAKTQHGYLLIADISGYTSFLATSELEHAHDILTELLEILIKQLTARLTLSKLEGDAVFVFAAETDIPRGETLLELIEATYVKFRDEREAIRRRTTCQCNACRNIPSLDLKFMAHHGDYLLQRVSGIHELVGSDVNLIHRLLKNHVSEQTGWRAYALFTEQALMHLGVKPEGMHEHIENYEHLGDVKVCVLNLADRYTEIINARRYVVDPKKAHFVGRGEVAATPSIVWDVINDSAKRSQLSAMMGGPSVKWVHMWAAGRRTGVNSVTHCIHGKDVATVETIRDWRPFDYFTVTQEMGMFKLDWQYVFTPLTDQSTQVEMRALMRGPFPEFIRRLGTKVFFNVLYTMKKWTAAVSALIEDDHARADRSTLTTSPAMPDAIDQPSPETG